ncbi:hypothetical protein [Algoriphagus yeomjeoni]|uniref:Uncharacterized protein n=1 Tax=Algoriphagus yeomjeoni TaxID=291403 RepID=A0A327PBM0_9BACT|nr:hypothetical protein [Algoriphagus yeomjeoni]RAI88442.1 hypothetical protein LV83_02742 [Algoriphagus yeomjeoni]
MHTLEPYFNWRNLYTAAEDPRSPFYEYENSEVYFTDTIYNFLIHPQWDSMESETLFLKVIYADYNLGFAVIELMGEWNDLLNNDIMTLKRNIIELMTGEGINKYILICENVLNFHGDLEADDYYEEWQDELEEGWIVTLNLRDHVLSEMSKFGIDRYLVMGGRLDDVIWRTRHPKQLFEIIDAVVARRLGL